MRRLTLILAVALAGLLAGLGFAVWPPPDGGDGDGPAGLDIAEAAAPTAVALERVPGDFSQPLYVAAPPGDGGRLFVVEKAGLIRIVKDGEVLPVPFLDLTDRVSTSGEQGLLSMAFHPRYAANGRFYVNFTNRDGHTRVVRYIASAGEPDRADPASAKVLLKVRQPYANHNGGQLQFGPDGRLYVGMGDGGSGGDPGDRAQDPASRHGKLLRLTLGTSPPKVGVYAKGLRNPWRFSFDRDTGALWVGDVGQNAREEIDYLRPGRRAGANFGWKGYEGSLVYDRQVASRLSRSALTWPVHEYGHTVGRSVIGGYVYRGSAIPELRGHYIFGDFVTGRVWAMKGRGGLRAPLAGADGEAGRVASFGEDAAGELYIASFRGHVYKIVPAAR